MLMFYNFYHYEFVRLQKLEFSDLINIIRSNMSVNVDVFTGICV